MRVFAAFLLAASKLPADAVDAAIVPEWLLADDAERYADGATLMPPDASHSLALIRH